MLALLLASPAFAQTTTESFPFHLASPYREPAGGEIWDATVKPDGVTDSVPVTFRLKLESPARTARAGNTIHATIHRGDRGGMQYFLLTFTDTFSPTTPSHGMTALSIPPMDSVPLTLTVEKSSGKAAWSALAELANGGRFRLVIDSAARRGEFRSVGAQYSARVFFGIVGISAPRS